VCLRSRSLLHPEPPVRVPLRNRRTAAILAHMLVVAHLEDDVVEKSRRTPGCSRSCFLAGKFGGKGARVWATIVSSHSGGMVGARGGRRFDEN